ncbi:hypothetical protein EX30DRAFT_340912 [Ascodesmis nigricans]|uniref:Uncharacterized protein n=1 Tax=Ascodesmis nigricans TaxID=341454 RepID=A0A4S2MX74_9PEZI|nr:hypothetical protein EX30DRAFT_340912 [Ascodesmis nigricans]
MDNATNAKAGIKPQPRHYPFPQLNTHTNGNSQAISAPVTPPNSNTFRNPLFITGIERRAGDTQGTGESTTTGESHTAVYGNAVNTSNPAMDNHEIEQWARVLFDATRKVDDNIAGRAIDTEKNGDELGDDEDAPYDDDDDEEEEEEYALQQAGEGLGVTGRKTVGALTISRDEGFSGRGSMTSKSPQQMSGDNHGGIRCHNYSDGLVELSSPTRSIYPPMSVHNEVLEYSQKYIQPAPLKITNTGIPSHTNAFDPPSTPTTTNPPPPPATPLRRTYPSLHLDSIPNPVPLSPSSSISTPLHRRIHTHFFIASESYTLIGLYRAWLCFFDGPPDWDRITAAFNKAMLHMPTSLGDYPVDNDHIRRRTRLELKKEWKGLFPEDYTLWKKGKRPAIPEKWKHVKARFERRYPEWKWEGLRPRFWKRGEVQEVVMKDSEKEGGGKGDVEMKDIEMQGGDKKEGENEDDKKRQEREGEEKNGEEKNGEEKKCEDLNEAAHKEEEPKEQKQKGEDHKEEGEKADNGDAR